MENPKGIMTRFKKKRAYTLTELMVTVTILGIVAGFGVTNFKQSKYRAQTQAQYWQAEMLMENLKKYFAINGQFVVDNPGNAASAINYLNQQLNVQMSPVDNFAVSTNYTSSGHNYSLSFTAEDGINLTVSIDPDDDKPTCSGSDSSLCP